MACVHRSAGGNLLFDRIWSRHEDVFSNGHEALEWHVQQTSECLVCQCIFTQPSYVSIHCNRLFNDEIHECGPATESWSCCWNFRRNASRNMTSESRSPMRTTRYAEWVFDIRANSLEMIGVCQSTFFTSHFMSRVLAASAIPTTGMHLCLGCGVEPLCRQTTLTVCLQLCCWYLAADRPPDLHVQLKNM